MEFLSWLENTEFCTWIRGSGSIWAYPLVLTLHTTGMGILVGFNWALDLRLLGVARQIPVLAMEKFFKVMWIGFWVNLITGIRSARCRRHHENDQLGVRRQDVLYRSRHDCVGERCEKTVFQKSRECASDSRCEKLCRLARVDANFDANVAHRFASRCSPRTPS